MRQRIRSGPERDRGRRRHVLHDTDLTRETISHAAPPGIVERRAASAATSDGERLSSGGSTRPDAEHGAQRRARPRREVGPRRTFARRAAAACVLAGLALPGCQLTPEELQLEEQGRAALSLDGVWQVWLDPGAVGLDAHWAEDLAAGRRPASAPSDPLELVVPGPLECSIATREYDGVSFWVREFRAPGGLRDARVRLRFGQVNYACRAWLDGAPLGEHEGGYDAFELDASGRLDDRGPHRLVVMVIDPGAAPVLGLTLRTTPHSKESWYENTGGLLGSVALLCDRGFVAPSLAVRADPASGAIDVAGPLVAPPLEDERPAVVRVAITVRDPAATAADSALERLAGRPPSGNATASSTPLAVQELDVPVGSDGRAQLEARLFVLEPRAWSPESPQLYEVTVEADGRAVDSRHVGFRSVSIERGNLLINGRRRVLKGVLWQPHFPATGGVTPPAAELEREAAEILATGFNLVRAHVRPAPPAFLDAADRLGLLVLEEPAIGWVEDDPALLPRLQHELDWMVARDAHHPSIILWGVLNELSGKAYRYARELTAHLAALDGTRPVLEDSGSFFGDGRVIPPLTADPAEPGEPGGEARERRMIDRHLYPPWPLPTEWRDQMARVGARDELVFVSEYGYGTLPDTVAAVAGFRERGRMDEERLRFESYAATARRANASGEAWRPTGWVAEAAVEQADAAEDMTEALRSNPALDLLCYTQWRAVSSECSAGLLEPWGQSRPARERMRHALRPLLAAVQPDRMSVAAGEDVACRVAIVNDTGVPLRARPLLHWTFESASGRTEGDVAIGTQADGTLDLPPGVTPMDVSMAGRESAGALTLVANLLDTDGHVVESSTARVVTVVAPGAPLPSGWLAQPGGFAGGGRAWPAPTIWAPPGDDAARDFLRRRGQQVFLPTPAGASVALISRPESLGEALSVDEQVALWSLVHRGGAAIVMLSDPADDPQAARLGQRGGMRTLTALPVPATVAAAAGNFMARLHLSGPPEQPRVLGRGNEDVSPSAMVLGDVGPPGAEPQVITLGHLGNRLGAPVERVPFGSGSITLVGLPLLQPIGRDIEPSRDALLAGLLGRARSEAREHLPPSDGDPAAATPAPLPPESAEELAGRLRALDRLVAFGDRASTLLGLAAQGKLPDRVAALPAARTQALVALIEGRADDARGVLAGTLEPLWTPETQGVLALEDEVLALLGDRAAAAGRGNWDAAYDAIEPWARGVVAWFNGDTPGALQWLAQARGTLEVRAGGAQNAPGPGVGRAAPARRPPLARRESR